MVQASGHTTIGCSARGSIGTLAACAWLVVVVATAFARDDARPLLDAFKRRDQTDRHWNDRVQLVTFDIHDGGPLRSRTLRFFEKRASDDSRKLLVRVLDPPSQRGIGVLLEVAANESGQQWFYGPELRRIRPITGSRFRQEPIVDSDLTHDDLELVTALPGWGADDAESHRRDSEAVDGDTCAVIDLVPKRESVPYKRITIWLGESLLVRRLEFSRDGSVPAKRITQTGFRDVGRIPVPHDIKVETLGEKPTNTDITVTDAAFDVGIGDECFNQSTLADPGKDADACRGTSK